jgi:hypothetical protein
MVEERKYRGGIIFPLPAILLPSDCFHPLGPSTTSGPGGLFFFFLDVLLLRLYRLGVWW